jgi:hypothetical protein
MYLPIKDKIGVSVDSSLPDKAAFKPSLFLSSCNKGMTTVRFSVCKQNKRVNYSSSFFVAPFLPFPSLRFHPYPYESRKSHKFRKSRIPRSLESLESLELLESPALIPRFLEPLKPLESFSSSFLFSPSFPLPSFSLPSFSPFSPYVHTFKARSRACPY